MAFRILNSENRKIQLVSLIDLIFILLIFFIMTSIFLRMTRGESKLFIPTPKNEPGEAQILIQILGENSYFWIDHTAIDTLNRYRSHLSSANNSRAKVDLLLSKMTLDFGQLSLRIADLETSQSKRFSDEYFVLIRCPDYLPFYYATEIIEKFVHIPNVEYGCVSGSIEDIKNSKNLFIKETEIQIDF